MIYGEITLKVFIDSFSIALTNNKLIRHKPGTDISDSVDLGRGSTRILCELKAESNSEKVLIMSLLHEDVERNLVIDDIMFKRVVAGETSEPKLISHSKELWSISAEFVALDPIPYDSVTEERLY